MIIQFICNLLTSSNNHLFLQLCRWLALMLEQATAKRTMTVTYHHRHLHLLMSSLHNFWEVRGLWRKPYASLGRTWLAPASNNRGLSQISTALSRISWTPSLLSSRWLKNCSRRMNGSTLLSKSSVYWGSSNTRRQNMHPISCRDRPGFGGRIFYPLYLSRHRSHGSSSS